jgi:hypothetical protein
VLFRFFLYSHRFIRSNGGLSVHAGAEAFPSARERCRCFSSMYDENRDVCYFDRTLKA